MSQTPFIIDTLKAAAGAGVPADPLPRENLTDKPNADQSLFNLNVQSILQKYAEEREKRLRKDGVAQYLDAEASRKFKRFAADPWINDDPKGGIASHLETRHKFVIVGAGFGGLCFAVRLIEAGFTKDDILIVDTAGGFGGTWYWNRYPNLMCDVESYIYLPLLEETGYMPKHKYSYGPEIRAYANRVADHWHLRDRAVFQTQVQSLVWQDVNNEWEVKMTQHVSDHEQTTVAVRADFVIVASGLLQRPKLVDFPDIERFHGPVFHTARWDYNVTGGSPEDQSLVNLKDKKVGIIGTGATAIQAIPVLAQWCKELYVFQRTPSSVDIRGQHETNPERWKKEIARGKGWQMERCLNFTSFTVNRRPHARIDMVSDGWTHMPSFSALAGGEADVTRDTVNQHVQNMHTLDMPRAERLRRRVDEIVHDKAVAEKLKTWYAGWCKRPTFHDDYLSTFNLSHVHLIDTDGKGIDNVIESGILANGRSYDLDVIIFSTGFNIQSRISPAGRAGISTTGRNGIDLEDKWSNNLGTLFGAFTRDFPNLFFGNGVNQGAAAVNATMANDVIAQTVAFIIAQAYKSVTVSKDASLSSPTSSSSCPPSQESIAEATRTKITIEPASSAETSWTNRISQDSIHVAAIANCTPSYYNREGAVDRIISTADKIKSARSSFWGTGLLTFMEYLDEWRKRDFMTDLDIRFSLREKTRDNLD